MGTKTKIDWCDATWNPVTGCLHGCKYCYARQIAERFKGFSLADEDNACAIRFVESNHHTIAEVEAPMTRRDKTGRIISAPYPFSFRPTLHRYRLYEPVYWKKPRNIFVCSMADLFGEWVPNAWIWEVFETCEAAPQHCYLFLTKNPSRYKELDSLVHWPTFEETNIEKSRPYIMLGASATNEAQMKAAYDSDADWVSIEPIHERLLTEWFVSSIGSDDGQCIEFRRWEWVVIGAETGNLKDKIIPKKEWIQEIVDICLQEGTPVFMKESLRDLMGDDFKQEFPW